MSPRQIRIVARSTVVAAFLLGMLVLFVAIAKATGGAA